MTSSPAAPMTIERRRFDRAILVPVDMIIDLACFPKALMVAVALSIRQDGPRARFTCHEIALRHSLTSMDVHTAVHTLQARGWTHNVRVAYAAECEVILRWRIAEPITIGGAS